ncbi:MAG: TMEM175 family protein [Methanocalculus sp.]|uniref:TMEM175 family protein n=1 Tax=Methanocalculus sp. TaxID=2004547 RepID=UPI00271EB73C|nr:TMEM175 family protein [Methanocalculus sp.]MDO9538741.1 TMEM175 family protein [Methanocalculus sp.]
MSVMIEGRFPKNRLEALTDGMFAIAMTILVLGIEVPATSTYPDAVSLVLGLLPELYHYALAFGMLMILWVVHHRQFGVVDHIDSTILWLSGISLLFIALIPFSTSLATEYGEDPLAPIFLEANLLIIGCIYAVIWQYTARKRLLKPTIDQDRIRVTTYRTLIVPITSIIAITVALAGSTWSTIAYLAIPFLKVIHTRLSERAMTK